MKRIKNFLFSLALMSGMFIPVRAQAFERDPLLDLQLDVIYLDPNGTLTIEQDYLLNSFSSLSFGNASGIDQTLDLNGHTIHFKRDDGSGNMDATGITLKGNTIYQDDHYVAVNSSLTIKNGTIIMEVPNNSAVYAGSAVTLHGPGTLNLENLTIINRNPEGAGIGFSNHYWGPMDQAINVSESVKVISNDIGILDMGDKTGGSRSINLEGSIYSKNGTIQAQENLEIHVRSGTYLSGGKPDLGVNRFIPEQCRGVNPVSGKVENDQHKPLTLEAINPTCTNEGRTAQIICSDCKSTLEESQSIKALGHTWTGWEITENQAIRECLECLETEVKDIEQTEPEQPETDSKEDQTKPSGSLIPSGNNKPSGNPNQIESGGNNNQTGASNESSSAPDEPFSSSLIAFKDVPDNHYAANSIAYLAQNKILNGYEDGRFGLNDFVSRGMIAQVFYNLAGNPPLAALESFEDVGQCFYTQAAAFVKSKGYMTGYDSSRFGGNDPITRQDLAVVLYRYSGSPIPDSLVNSYADGSEVSEYAVKAMNWAIEQGIIRGRDQKYLAPKDPTTRAELAVMFHRYLEV